ncbi:hypothetical protein DRE_06738 [Drechslerella stenobrocha 248]|uniref:Cep57 centrosome microtubule-binding domain-containing protein n=1 Tax=Drechslerella stenobrocha 248 TaxID=1043628 RepID=W7I6P1_9PEZI|nr:hypothetical protein DRE_06738 [Drechslerella stenobrocha 248]
MHSSYIRSPSQSTTHGSYFHDSDQDAHDYTRLRLQRQLARDLSYTSSQGNNARPQTNNNNHNEENTDPLNIMEDAAAMSTRRYDDVLPSTPDLNSKIINQHFKDFSTIGVGIRTRLFPHLSNHPDESMEIGRAGDEHTKTDRSTTTTSIFARVDKGKLAVPNAGINAAPKRPAISPNTRARCQPFVADESIDLSSHSITGPGSRLQGGNRRSRSDLKATKDQAARERLEEALKKENVPVRPQSQTSFLATKRNGAATTVFLNKEKLFKDMGLGDDHSDYSDIKPDSPSVRTGRARAAPKPVAPQTNTVNSIKLPDMTGISDLVSSVNHGYADVSRRAQYVPINAVPVPDGERELLQALKKLQVKVEALEADKAKEKKRAERLEKDCEETRQLYQMEYNGRRELEVELTNRRRVDSALGGEIDSEGGSPRSSGDRERMKAQHKAEIKKLDGVVAAYRHRIQTMESSQDALQTELQSVTEERDSAVLSLAKAISKNDMLQDGIEKLRQECEEMQQENEAFAQEIDRLQNIEEQYQEEIEHERKLMNDKLNRYREKVLRAGKVATEATLAAHDAARIARNMQDSGTQTQTARQQVPEAVVESGRQAPTPSQRGRRMPKGVKEAEPVASPQDRVQVQVDAELKKLFPQHVTTVSSKRKVSGSTIASRASRKPHVKKTRVVMQEFSETDSERSAGEEEGGMNEASVAQAHMDTTFTAPSISDSRMHRETGGDLLPDHTLHSFLQSEGLATLRKEISELRKLEEQRLQQMRLEKAEAKKAQLLAERAAQRVAATAGGDTGAKKRVFIYSEKDNETTVTELDQNEAEETPHPFLRTSMMVNDSDDEAAYGDILAGVPSRPPSQQTVRGQQQQLATLEHRRRDTEDFYNEHVQEVINQLGVHKPDLCTICHRKSAIGECNVRGHSGNIVNQTVDDLVIPEVVPVSKRALVGTQTEEEEVAVFEGEITMRPSQPPKMALDKVVKQMEDELEHMRLDYKNVETEFLACDPSLGRRKRKSLTHQLNSMVEQMDKKSDQIYALYDVAEMVHEEDASGSEHGGRRSRSNSSSGGRKLRERKRHVAV